MKKIALAVSIVVLIFVTSMFTFFYVYSKETDVKQHNNRENLTDNKVPERNTYDLKVEYLPSNKLNVEMNLTFVNNTDQVLDELYFNLYPNIHKSLEHTPFFKSDLAKVYPQGFSSGGINILKIKQDADEIKWSTIENDLFLNVKLNKSIGQNQVSNINMRFDVNIPKANYRFGYQEIGDDTIIVSLGNWYPILAVFENGKWCLDKHCGIGDSFYSDISDYNVQFTVPENYTVAASGSLIKQYSENNKTFYLYSMEKIRDFAATISNNYEMAEDMIDGIKVVSYFLPEDSKGGFAVLDIVKQSLHIYNKCFGYYPYPEIRIAEANFYAGGMEYPTFIMMSKSKYKEPYLSNTSLERSTAHEVAHQWWYGMVGNDEINEPWIDEGITEFSCAYYFEKRYGPSGKKSYYNKQVYPNLNLIKQSKRTMLDPLPYFTNNREYFAIVYINGSLFYEDLRKNIGDENLFNFLRSYFEAFKFKNVHLSDFKQFLINKNYEGLDDSFFDKWF